MDSEPTPVRRANAPPVESLSVAARAQLAKNTGALQQSSLRAKYTPLASSVSNSPLGKPAEAPASPPGFTDEVTAHFHFDVTRPESAFKSRAGAAPSLELANGRNIQLEFDDPAIAEGIASGKLQAIVTGVKMNVISPNARGLEFSTPGLKARTGEKGFGIGDGTPMARVMASALAKGHGHAEVVVFQRQFSDNDRAAMKAHSASIASGLEKTFVKTPMGTYMVAANTPLALMGVDRDGVVHYEDHSIFKDEAVFKAVFAETDAHIKQNYSLMNLADFRVRITPMEHLSDDGKRVTPSFKAHGNADPNVHLAGDGQVTLHLFEKADSPV